MEVQGADGLMQHRAIRHNDSSNLFDSGPSYPHEH